MISKFFEMDNEGPSALIYSLSSLGIFTNLLLLYFVLSDNTKSHFGYKKMLLIVIAYNIYYACLHPILDMGFLIDEYGFVMFSKAFATSEYVISYMAIMIYMDAFTMSFTLLAVHCLYRYVKVSGKWKFMFDKKRWLFGLVLFSIGFGPIWCIITHFTYQPTTERTELSRSQAWLRYNVDMETIGYLGPILKWKDPMTGEMSIRWFNTLGSFGCLSILLILYALICIGCIKLYLFIKNSIISERAKRVHFQLLRILVIQAVVPLLFGYFPCICAIWGGFLGLPLSEVAVYIPVITSAYALVDGLMTILGFKMYRYRFYALFDFGCYKRQVISKGDHSQVEPQNRAKVATFS